MKKDEHPFFCKKKQCRKTAWETPEYMTEPDWAFLKKIVAVLETGDGIQLHDLIWDRENGPNLIRDFFYHTIGWPEGHTYCMTESFTVKTAFGGMKTHMLPKMKKALENHE